MFIDANVYFDFHTVYVVNAATEYVVVITEHEYENTLDEEKEQIPMSMEDYPFRLRVSFYAYQYGVKKIVEHREVPGIYRAGSGWYAEVPFVVPNIEMYRYVIEVATIPVPHKYPLRVVSYPLPVGKEKSC